MLACVKGGLRPPADAAGFALDPGSALHRGRSAPPSNVALVFGALEVLMIVLIRSYAEGEGAREVYRDIAGFLLDSR